MRRLLTLAALVGLAAPLAVALPVATLPAAAAQPAPVAPQLTRLPVAAAPAPGRAVALSGHTLELPARATRPFSTLGVTWVADPSTGPVRVQVRTRSRGLWSGWTPLSPDAPTGSDEASDPGSADSRGARSGTEPVWVGPSDGVHVRVTAAGAVRPRDVRVELVDGGTGPGDAAAPVAPLSVASADEGRPAILSRAAWGADERIRAGSPSYYGTVRAAFVHHTASTSSYTAAQAMAMVRGIYAYHVQGRGWSDVGYQFLVDKYGRVYEGRAGGVERFVAGAHTGGFNRETFGVAFLGDYSTTAPPAVAVRAAERLLAWKLAGAYRDPAARTWLRSAGGSTARFAAGSWAGFGVVAAHRDAGYTSCPGDPIYARMPEIRAAVAGYLGAGFVAPTVARDGARVVVSAGATRRLAWRATVVSPNGAVVRELRGTGATVQAVWDGRDRAGRTVPVGTYAVRLTGSGGGDTARSWTGSVRVGGATAPAPAPAPGPSTPSPAPAPTPTPPPAPAPAPPAGLPSGTTLRGPDGRTHLLRQGRLSSPTRALLAAVRPGAGFPVTAAQLAALPRVAGSAPQGLAGRDRAGVVRVADGGRVVALSTAAATALGYRRAALPVLAAGDFGLPVVRTTLAPDRHPDGTLVRAGGRAYLLRGGVRRPVHASFLPTYGARPVLPAAAGDPVLVGPPVGPADGAFVRTPVGAAYVVEGGVRRWVLGPAAARLRWPASHAVLVDAVALAAATTRGPDIG